MVKFAKPKGEFYNAEIKKKFFSEEYTGLSKRRLDQDERAFEQIADFETIYNKDLYDFTNDEFVKLFEANGWVRYSTIASHRTTIKNYLDWAYKNKLISAEAIVAFNDFSAKSLDGLSTYRMSYFRDFKDLVSAYKQADPSGKLYNAEPLVYLMWIYSNQDCLDIIDIKVRDVDLHNKRIVIGNKIFDMPNELCAAIEPLLTARHPNRYPDPHESDFIFRRRGAGFDRVADDFITRKLVVLNIESERVCGNKKRQFATQRIVLSSIFARAYEIEINRAVDSHEDNTKEIIGELFPNTDRGFIYAVTNDYVNWKKAFYGE